MVKEAHCNVEEILKLIQYHIPAATVEKNANNEISFLLPKEYTHRYESRECKMTDVWITGSHCCFSFFFQA